MSRAFQKYPFQPDRHSALLPRLVDGADSQRYDVAIVGAGIAGLTTALGLASHGVRSIILEADESVCVGSRAICISRRSLEIIARLGALQPFLSKGLPWTGGRSFYRNVEALHFQMPHDASQRLPPMLNLQQYYIEQFLVDAAQKTGLIEVRWQSRVLDITPCEKGVDLTVDTPAGKYRLAADWLVGCDGARSVVRESAGLKFQGTSYEGRYVIVDVWLKSDRATERLAWFDPPSNPDSTILMHRTPDDVWRIDYQLLDDEDPEAAIRPENVIPRVASHLQMIGERDDWAPIWISLYKANALTLETYRKDRLLLAGDAAHLVPIFGVRGANSCFEDADNLAWKLAFVIKGLAPDALLDTYCDERVHAARENLRQGMKSTEFMSPPAYGFELMRTAVLGLAVENSYFRPLLNPRQTQPISYSQSALNGPGKDGFAAGPSPGDVAIECRLMLLAGAEARDGHLTELLGPVFTAFYFSVSDTIPSDFESLRTSQDLAGLPFRFSVLAQRRPSSAASQADAYDHFGLLFSLYDAQPGTVYLVRPDGHVLARWRTGTAASVRAAIEHVHSLYKDSTDQ